MQEITKNNKGPTFAQTTIVGAGPRACPGANKEIELRSHERQLYRKGICAGDCRSFIIIIILHKIAYSYDSAKSNEGIAVWADFV